MNFKKWLEMAVVSRQPLAIDEDDITYLKQFPFHAWSQALKARYNDLIFKAVQYGELKKDWSDEQPITYGKMHKKTIVVNTGISALIQKLKNHGFDLSGTNDTNQESVFYKPMEMQTAVKTIASLVKTIPQSEKEKYKNLKLKGIPDQELNQVINPAPNQVTFSPNHLQTRRNDIEPTDDKDYRASFEVAKPKIINLINKNIELLKNKGHINAVYWHSQSKKLFDTLYQYVLTNWKEEDFRNLNSLQLKVANKLRTILQNGIISRRDNNTFNKMGLNTYGLLNKVNPNTGQNWTIDDIQGVMRNHSDNGQRYSQFTAQTAQGVSGEQPQRVPFGGLTAREYMANRKKLKYGT